MCVSVWYIIIINCIILLSAAHTTRGSGDCITDVSRGVYYITRIIYAPRRTVVIILCMCIVSCCYYYFSVNFFIFFFCLFPIGIFPTKNRNRMRFPPAAPGRSSEASDTSHTSLSRQPCGCPGPADSSRSYSTYVPRGDRILNLHTHTHSYTYAYKYYNTDTEIHIREIICTRHCFVNDDVRNSRATVYCVRRATLTRPLTTDCVSPNDVRCVFTG